MRARQVLLYFAWSRPAETSAPLAAIDDRFPAVFELRRLFYPKFEPLSDRGKFDQGIAGFLDHVQKPNFRAFVEQAGALTGRPVIQIERISDDGVMMPLDRAIVGVDTIVVISFDSLRTNQAATAAEVEAIRRFLDDPDHLIFICPHHDIGEPRTRWERTVLSASSPNIGTTVTTEFRPGARTSIRSVDRPIRSSCGKCG